MMENLGALAFWALLISLAIWITRLEYKSDKERGLIPSFADCVDTAGCITVLIVVTNWLGLWDADPRPDPGVDVGRIIFGFLKAIFLILVPAAFLLHFMRRFGSLGRRATIYGGILAIAVVISFIRD
jgi:hypothetical protein